MLEAFSRSLETIYRLSEQCSPDIFQIEVLHVIQAVITYDGVVLRFGSTILHLKDGHDLTRLHVATVAARQLEKAILDKGGKVVDLNGGSAARDAACPRQQREQGNPDNFIDALDAGNLLFLAAEKGRASYLQWIFIYRKNDSGFNNADIAFLQHCWSHLQQACMFNLSRMLSNHLSSQHLRSMGLLNSDGTFDIVDATLTELLKQEWPDHGGTRLPSRVLSELISENIYRGQKIELLAFPKHGCIVCEGRKKSMFSVLAPAEKKIAYLFATGLSYSKIASQLQVSPYTVRNQLTQIYQKLAIHSKAELAKIIAKI